MKDLYIVFLFLLWMIFTVGLCLSVIGICLIAKPEYNQTSTWMKIGFDLKDKLIK